MIPATLQVRRGAAGNLRPSVAGTCAGAPGSIQFLRVQKGSGFNPYSPSLSNAANYSLAGGASDATYIKDSSNRLSLIADRSGNSAVNVLNFDGTTGCTATITTPTSDATYSFKVSIPAANPASAYGIFSIGGSYPVSASVVAYIDTAGVLEFDHFGSSTSNYRTAKVAGFVAGHAGQSVTLTYVLSGNTITLYVDGVATALTTATGGTPPDWNTALGNGGLFVGKLSTASNIFVGNIYNFYVYTRALSAGEAASLYAGSVPSGSLVLNAAISSSSKLAATITDASGSGATITLPATGAWVSGARDLVQLTQAKQPIFSTVNGYNIATFDGSNDYMKAAPFSLSQPESVYFVGSQVTWTLNDYLYDGNALNAMTLSQTTAASPKIEAYAGGVAGSLTNTGLALATRGVVTTVYSGAVSSLSINRGTAATGNPGTNSANGFTLGAQGGTLGSSNITFSEVLIRSVADSAQTQQNFVNALMAKWGVQ